VRLKLLALCLIGIDYFSSLFLYKLKLIDEANPFMRLVFSLDPLIGIFFFALVALVLIGISRLLDYMSFRLGSRVRGSTVLFSCLIAAWCLILLHNLSLLLI